MVLLRKDGHTELQGNQLVLSDVDDKTTIAFKNK